MLDTTQDVAIIGGGLAGMAMALSLHDLNIPCVVYEMRPDKLAPHRAGGAMMICPNALRILDRLGVYRRMLKHAYSFEYVYYKDANEETVDRYPLGGEAAWGYKCLRIYRQELLDALYAECGDRGIPVRHDSRFARVVDETAEGVSFELADGTVHRAQLLVGADGIHSRVRDHVSPGARTRFTGLVALTCAVPTSQLRVPADKDYAFPVTVATAAGVFVLAPQRPDGSEMLAGTQVPSPERTRDEWAALLADRDGGVAALLRRNLDGWPDLVRSALEHIDPDTANVWPFYLLPALPRWTSAQAHRRVVVLGDAAHALPPTTGQGASQAFEDVFALSLLVARVRDGGGARVPWADALAFWQEMRQDRIDQLVELTRKLNNKRLPTDKQALLGKDDIWTDETKDNPHQMDWLYAPYIEDKIEAWVREKYPAEESK